MHCHAETSVLKQLFNVQLFTRRIHTSSISLETKLSLFLLSTGCTVEITFPGYSYADIKPAKILNNIYQKHAESLGVTFPDFKNRPGPEKDFAGSTDMGNVSYMKPSIHPMYRIGNAINHTKEFTAVAGLPAAQKPTLDSAKAMMMTAIEVLTNSDLLKKIKEEFEQT